MIPLGDIAEDATLDFKWPSNDGSGGSITRTVDGTISVYKGNNVVQSTAGITDTEDFDTTTGVHHCRIDTSADAFYAVANDYQVVLTAATIDGQTVNTVIAHFSIENRSGQAANDRTLLALPAVAADGAGGLPISDAGGLDLDGMNTNINDIETALALVPQSGGTTTWNGTALASINAEMDTGLADYDGPTKAELDSGFAGQNDLDAAGIRTAVGLAAANLDTQLADLPTVAEFEARTLIAASYFDPALDPVAVVTLCGTLTTYTGNTPQTADHTAGIADIPTVAEFNTRTPTAAAIANLELVFNTDFAGVYDTGTNRFKGDVIAQGTLQSATATAAVLAAGTSFADDVINDSAIRITGGTGVGQVRPIEDWDLGTVTATVTTWTVTPDGTSTYDIIPGVAATVSGTVDANLISWLGTGVTGDGDWTQMMADLAAVLVDTAAMQATVNAALTAYGVVATTDLPTNFGAQVITAGGAVDSLLQGFLNNTIAETTPDNIAHNFEVFWDNANAITTNTVDDVGGAGSFWTPAEQEQCRYKWGIDGTKTAPTASRPNILDVKVKESHGVASLVTEDFTRYPIFRVPDKRREWGTSAAAFSKIYNFSGQWLHIIENRTDDIVELYKTNDPEEGEWTLFDNTTLASLNMQNVQMFEAGFADWVAVFAHSVNSDAQLIHYNPLTKTTSGPVTVNSAGSNWDPVIIPSPTTAGTWFCFYSKGDDSSNVQGKKSTDSGVTWGTEFNVMTNAAGRYEDLKAGVNTRGEIVLIAEREIAEGGESYLHARVMTDETTPTWEAEYAVDGDGTIDFESGAPIVYAGLDYLVVAANIDAGTTSYDENMLWLYESADGCRSYSRKCRLASQSSHVEHNAIVHNGKIYVGTTRNFSGTTQGIEPGYIVVDSVAPHTMQDGGWLALQGMAWNHGTHLRLADNSGNRGFWQYDGQLASSNGFNIAIIAVMECRGSGSAQEDLRVFWGGQANTIDDHYMVIVTTTASILYQRVAGTYNQLESVAHTWAAQVSTEIKVQFLDDGASGARMIVDIDGTEVHDYTHAAASSPYLNGNIGVSCGSNESTEQPIYLHEWSVYYQSEFGLEDREFELTSERRAINDLSLSMMKTDLIRLPGQIAPPLTPTFEEAIAWWYKMMRNKKTQDATDFNLFDDAGTTVDATATVSDVAGTLTRNKMGAGP